MRSARLGRQLYAVILLLMLLFVGWGATYSYRAIDRELTDTALGRRASIAYLTSALLTEKFERLVDIGVSLASRVRFRELVEAGNWTEASKVFTGVQKDFPFIDRIALIAPDGTPQANIPPAPEIQGQNSLSRDWYQELTRDPRPYISQIYLRNALPQKNVFVTALPIKNNDGKMLGILVLQVGADSFFEWLKDIAVGPQGFIYIVDQRGTLAAHSALPPQTHLVNYSDKEAVHSVLQGNRGIDIQTDPAHNVQRVVAYEPIAKHGWAVLLSQPTGDAFAARDGQLKLVLIAYTLVAAFIACASYLLLRITTERRRTREDRRLKSLLEQRVSERTSQLEETNKELESFSYSVSHDLRTPLRAVSGYIRILQDDHASALADDGKACLAVVRREADRMAKLIDELLAFSRLGREKMKALPVDMTDLVREVIEELKLIAPQATQFFIEPLPVALGDRVLLRQVWINLIGNAVKYSSKRAQPEIRISGKNDQHNVVYRVEDNGCGFDMRYYDKLFGVFQRLHHADEFSGTGIGLAIVHRIITRSGGRVWAASELGRNAVFYFSLPSDGNKS